MSLFLLCQEEPLNIGLYFEIKRDNNHIVEENSGSDEFLSSLILKEQKSYNLSSQNDSYLLHARKESIFWIKNASSRFGFSALTVILAVNYLDRCFLSSNGLRLQSDKPWMKQLSAVASLSLAAKVEEAHVPFLLDLQISNEECTNSFIFEPKTIRRMELLMLSTLDWTMHPTTAISIAQCILPAFELDAYNVVELLRTCESILLSVLEDSRWVQFSPSVWASAAIMYTMSIHIDEMPLFNLLHVSKERVEECYSIITELLDEDNKRKFRNLNPPSPNEVVNSCFSYESSSSSDSWAVASPPLKKSKCSII